MAVQIGNSYVLESAVVYAQRSRLDEKSENVLGDLQKQFRDVNFSVGTQPFSGTGTNNISIAPNILREMANNPEKRLEYEALIYDCTNTLKSSANRPGLKAQGFIIGADGGLRGWGISQSGDGKSTRSLMNFTDDERARLAGRLPEKERTKASTDKVDAEIKQLKAKRAQLEQQISAESTPNADLQRQLAQIDDELRKKDNDTYRRAHATFSSGIDIKI